MPFTARSTPWKGCPRLPERCALAREDEYFDEVLRQLRLKSHRIIFRVEEASKIVRVLYVLHAFQKKSTSGISTPQRHIDLVKQRLRDAYRFYAHGGDLSIPRAYGARWIIVDLKRHRLTLDLPRAYADRRYVLYRLR